MEKLKEAIAELKGINTNDPAMQRKVVGVLEEILVVLEEKKVHKHFTNCGCR